MSKRIDPPVSYRTTDHSEEIERMLTAAADTKTTSVQTRLVLFAAADLLQCHDDTGISLDNWEGPRNLVQHALGLVRAPGAFLENAV